MHQYRIFRYRIFLSSLSGLATVQGSAVPWLSQKTYFALGQHLAEIRRQAGVTQDELAERLRKPQSFVSAYERGQRRVDLLEFLAIADALAVAPEPAFAAILDAIRRPGGRGRQSRTDR